jgi:integrase
MGKLNSNPAQGIKHLYASDRSEIIWTDADIDQVKAGCSDEVKWVIDLAAHTGLRVGDLLRVSWSHVGPDAIVISTGKSRHKREAIIPRYDALNKILEAIPRRSPVILTSTKKRPWKQDGFNSMFWRAKKTLGCFIGTCIFTTSEAPPRQNSILPDCRSASSQR